MFDADAYYRAEIDYRRDQMRQARKPVRRRRWTRVTGRHAA